MRIRTGIEAVDEVVVPGSVGLTPGELVILSGQPGSGTTTLLLQMAAGVAKRGVTAVYLTTEQGAADIYALGARIGLIGSGLFVSAIEPNVDYVRAAADKIGQPAVLVVDSLRAFEREEAIALATYLRRAAKFRQIVIIAHVGVRQIPDFQHESDLELHLHIREAPRSRKRRSEPLGRRVLLARRGDREQRIGLKLTDRGLL